MPEQPVRSDAAQADVPDLDDVPDAGRARRRPSVAEVFGDVLPDNTADEQGSAQQGQAGDPRDEEFLRDVPPHHG